VQKAQGDLQSAVSSYQEVFAIRQRRAMSNPANTEWQYSLVTASHDLGDAQRTHGDMEAALMSYQAALAAIEPLAQSDPANDNGQRLLTITHLRIGQTLVNLGHLPEALTSFNTAISIGKATDNSEIYVRRALVEYETDDANAAVQDLTQAVKLKPASQYDALWLHVAHVRAGQTDTDEIAANASHLDRSKWPWPVAALFTAATTPNDVFKAASSEKDEKTRIGNTCEANFFVGVHQIAKGNPAAARSLFQSAVDHCPHDFFEYTAANYELKRLGSSISKLNEKAPVRP
jgi:tetratricopeptide (TPR) repeat protein